MLHTYEVRQATIEDLEPLTELFDQYRVFYEQATDLNGARAFLFERLEHQESVLFIVQHIESGKLAGFTQLYPIFSSVSMKRVYLLNDLYVHESYRKQGIAQLLLDQAQRYAKRMRAKGLELATALDNLEAQRLYERCGYTRDEQFCHYYRSAD
ncbi:GNAT family N-acetyltransferase [Paenibacillus sp. GCM10023252]|uniref:GNAT family N-acetyltransferase n=1 Tax=Paenibacillus sp. GCM10023252 TaxID=3252649 RepID=UPI00360DDEFC